MIARAGAPVPGTAYQWPAFPDGAATFSTPDGGWILTVNSEIPGGLGGASSIRFDRDGVIKDAYRVLSDTSSNCAGGASPWGTWLSCEEVDDGLVWECDPTGKQPAVSHSALGTFKHEAVCFDPRRGHVYLSEDLGEGGFYRVTPDRTGDLSSGLLEIAKVRKVRTVRWKEVPDPSASDTPTREQVKGATRFKHGEGIFYDHGHVYLATTSDSRIWRYSVSKRIMKVIYDPETIEDPPLKEVDNVLVSRSGDIFVAEDNGGAESAYDIGLITSGRRVVTRFGTLTGPQHGDPSTDAASEVVGLRFDPSGSRLYMSSQRGFGAGVTYEITGPFRKRRPGRGKRRRRR